MAVAFPKVVEVLKWCAVGLHSPAQFAKALMPDQCSACMYLVHAGRLPKMAGSVSSPKSTTRCTGMAASMLPCYW